ncbi:hypothetical protein D3C78_1156230 [compost metagenome]
MLDALRRVILYPPFTPISLLIRSDDYDTRLFCKTTGPFEVLERQVSAPALQQALIAANPPSPHRSQWFSREEWIILQFLSQGQSLRHIALMRQRPYSRIVYRLGRILDKLGLHHRQELLHLLHRLSDPPSLSL